MCLVSTSATTPATFPTNHLQLFLNELEKRNVKFTIDRNQKLNLVQKLPSEVAGQLPKELIPDPVIQVFNDFNQGTLRRELLGAPKYHDRIKILRRYHLIPQVVRRSKEEKRAHNRSYLKKWRRAHSVSAC